MPLKKEDYKFDTLSIHGGGDHKNPKNALNPPIFQTSTFVFDSTDHVDDVMSFKSDDYVYTRGNNPTLRLFEQRMSVLENGTSAVAFASGMAAISSVLFSLTKPGDNILVHRTIYGSSYNVVTSLLPKYNINCRIHDLSKTDELEEAIDENTKVIYFETPSNPNLSIIDIKKITSFAKAKGIKVVIDNTFATPYFQRPLEMGVDVVVHSATKYICGHGDVVAGVAVARDDEYIQTLKFDYMCEFGGVLSPFNAWLLLRGLKTLGVRMRQHEKNAMAIARYLEAHPKVTSVAYPGLESFEGHKIAAEQMSGFGAMISFEVDGGLDKAKKVVNSVQLAQLAVSLGDCETLIELPAAMTHRGYDKAKLAEFGLTESMVRISAGLEDVDDIIADLEQALAQI
ncbi:aminotransferase class I/II-fold pyridoxal phosphate-dependent enzyme [Oceanispirochaeta sp. M2]|nr:aminotransferase class I/II-fold pyridoxal phosphate-dependent enzyme [Oceanispirochaeta sp. M2]NPD74140.1 aminotransferase class I/II-fold pyridoxal phosphate-dependent enzyme [Oceanispirochaeta sp. M1]RDG30060.1 aminotransferase class I/II-fold pyridoxal phosphate-dependent enzyme [Oceanispirochaeta sp. M1]